jgi:hypothetical protein
MQRNKLLMNAKKSCYVTFGYSVNPVSGLGMTFWVTWIVCEIFRSIHR